MTTRAAYSTKITPENRDKLQLLSQITRIPQSKLMDEAIEDLLEKYKDLLEDKKCSRSTKKRTLNNI